MSYSSSASCVTCNARNKKCDGTRSPSGCQRCAQARISCGGYSDTSFRITRLKHNVRENQPHTNPTHHSYPENSNKIPDSMTSSISPSPLDDTSSLVENSYSASATPYREYLGYPAPQQDVSTHPDYLHILYAPHYTPPVDCTSTPAEPLPILSTSRIPLADHVPRTVQLQLVVPSQANLTNSMFYLPQSDPVLPLTPESPDPRFGAENGPDSGREHISNTVQGESSVTQWRTSSSPQVRTEATVQWPASYLSSESEPEDLENIEAGLLNGLAPDRQVESNTLPFIVHSFAAWMTRFVSNPTRILPFLVNHIRRGYSFGDDSRQTMVLISNSVLAIARSTDYDLTHFNTLYKLLTDRVMDARARSDSGLTRELALGAMEHSHQFISALFKVGSLANVLNVMELYAPVFRRACPESNEELVNFPRRLTAMEIQLKYYAALDVLQSVITHRPMFFRYSLEFLSAQEEMFIKMGNGPGLGWLYGISDRLMVVLARINTLFEDFGNCVDPEAVQELEKEIVACEPVVYTSTEEDPTLNIGRIMVQEAWRLAANLYLYMALCGADSADARVVGVQKKVMRLLRAIKPRRNPDSFLVLPILVFGVAAISPTDQSTLLARLSGVSECSRPGTVGNDILRMLNDIWVRTVERPAIWSDLRTACLRITGM
ncbi:hypothetical protein ACGC1H_005349 [Rhizoctonia solani]